MSQLVVVTGLSGSGKTLALRCLEDLGYFAVDNLPVPLLGPFLDLLHRGEELTGRGALAVDIRERHHLEALPAALSALRARGDIGLHLLFFEASDEVLLRRFSESRRPHPLAQAEQLPVAQAIASERQRLAELRQLADRVISTDGMNPIDLRRLISEAITGASASTALKVQVISFGFKHGPPRDADLMFDARFLSNPHFTPELRPLSGRDEPVRQYLERLPDYSQFLRQLEQLLDFLMPRFVIEGKSYLTIAVGCTGGRHRSVAIAEELSRFLRQRGFETTVVHRDLQRDDPH